MIDLETYANSLQDGDNITVKADLLKAIDQAVHDIKALRKANKRLKIKEIKTRQKLAFFENKIQNNTTVDLPCKVGDTIYSPTIRGNLIAGKMKMQCGIVSDVVENITIRDDIVIIECKNGLRVLGEWIGTLVFLTKEQANELLEELKRSYK